MNVAEHVLERPDEIAQLMENARRASELMKALSHEARLTILCLLVEGEKPVSELERRLGLPQASVSQHLARLRGDALVKARRDGRMIHYSIATPEVTKIMTTLHDIYCSPRC